MSGGTRRVPPGRPRWDSVSAVSARIREAADTIGGLSELARRTGIPLRTLNDYLAKNDLPLGRAAWICAETRASLDWLATGEGAGPPSAAERLRAEVGRHSVDDAPPGLLADRSLLDEPQFKGPGDFGTINAKLLAAAIQVTDELVEDRKLQPSRAKKAAFIAAFYAVLVLNWPDFPAPERQRELVLDLAALLE